MNSLIKGLFNYNSYFYYSDNDPQFCLLILISAIVIGGIFLMIYTANTRYNNLIKKNKDNGKKIEELKQNRDVYIIVIGNLLIIFMFIFIKFSGVLTPSTPISPYNKRHETVNAIYIGKSISNNGSGKLNYCFKLPNNKNVSVKEKDKLSLKKGQKIFLVTHYLKRASWASSKTYPNRIIKSHIVRIVPKSTVTQSTNHTSSLNQFLNNK